jgi:hypothetical protein
MSDAIEATEFLCVTDLLKATPREEGGARLVYIEASNQARDFQGEVVLSKALAESAPYFASYGNFDIDHFTIPSVAQRAGIFEPMLWEIGQPIEVQLRDGSTFVKGEIYRGDDRLAEKANEFWASLTQITPPRRWYPSVGGSVLGRRQGQDPLTKAATTFISAVRWTNIGFSRTPVNPAVPTVKTVPFGALTKSWGEQGFDLCKALEGGAESPVLAAGHEPDPSKLTGGAALRRQSLEGSRKSYFSFRERVAGDLRKGLCGQRRGDIAEHAVRHLALSIETATDWADRFLSDLSDEIARNRAP